MAIVKSSVLNPNCLLRPADVAAMEARRDELNQLEPTPEGVAMLYVDSHMAVYKITFITKKAAEAYIEGRLTFYDQPTPDQKEWEAEVSHRFLHFVFDGLDS